MTRNGAVPLMASPAAEDPASPAVALAGRLQEELSHTGITATVGSGYGLAIVTAANRVNVWVEAGPQGWQFRWWTGRVCEQTGRWNYTSCPASAVETAARRVGGRVRQVRREALSVARVGRAGDQARANLPVPTGSSS
ncbi:hypothetical protein Msi02_77970 [Microbispora siamensis]|uniref:Uncharacterized protein n=1 Tax=Microbispora siamensis TaxID=564413 RepID=A0ABQ4GZW0_9ACTN|nr:hypothetical protein Msi02_77970 [Microbispora siamensis]